MARARVVITGVGVLSPNGNSAPAFWNACLEGRSGIGPITKFDTQEFDVHFGGEIKGFDPAAHMDEKVARRLDPVSQFGMAAAAEALHDSAIDLSKCDLDRFGVIIGSGIGGLLEIEQQHRKLFERGPGRVSPFFIPKHMMNATPGHISIRWGLRGPNFSCASACASSNHAMGAALRTIQYGDADLVITGGAEAALTPSGLAGFSQLKAVSTRNDNPQGASRPFDKDRDGFVLSEGAACLIFESLDHAMKRNAKIYAEVVGYGATGDAFHITAPDEEGRGGAMGMKLAIKDAGRRPEDVTYINAHGTSTPLNDAIETRAIKSVFGAHAPKIPINSTKSLIGHLLGGTGALECVILALSIRDQKLHPTINYTTPDPACDLDYVPNQARKAHVDLVLSNSLGFGGHNATIACARFVK